jgi:hypothetical protein
MKFKVGDRVLVMGWGFNMMIPPRNLARKGTIVEITPEEEYDADIMNGNVCVGFEPNIHHPLNQVWYDDSQLEKVDG